MTTQSDLISLLTLLFLIDNKGVLTNLINDELPHHGALHFWLQVVSSQNKTLRFKIPALKLLPFFFKLSNNVQRTVTDSLDAFRAHHLPIMSTEYGLGSARDREFQETLSELLSAFQLTGSEFLLKFVANLFCREQSHRYAHLLQNSIFQMHLNDDAKQLGLLHAAVKIAQEQTTSRQQQFRSSVVKEILLPLMSSASAVCLERLFVSIVNALMSELAKPLPSKADEQLIALSSKIMVFSMVQVS